MTTNKWFPIAEEITGTTPSMVWIINKENQMALFKPDMTGNDYLIEDTSLCKIAFLDALCRNQDRHIGNIDFLISLSNKTVAPSYDTVLSLSNSFTESAMLGITSSKTCSHRKIFSYLKSLDFMQDTIAKIQMKEFKELCSNLVYGDFIYNRAKEFINLP